MHLEKDLLDQLLMNLILKKNIWNWLAVASRCVIAGVDILRVHDIKEISQVVMMTKSII